MEEAIGRCHGESATAGVAILVIVASGVAGAVSTAIRSSASTLDKAFWALSDTPHRAAHRTKIMALGTYRRQPGAARGTMVKLLSEAILKRKHMLSM